MLELPVLIRSDSIWIEDMLNHAALLVCQRVTLCSVGHQVVPGSHDGGVERCCLTSSFRGHQYIGIAPFGGAGWISNVMQNPTQEQLMRLMC